MSARDTGTAEEQPPAGTPEDVAILYAWANLEGARYRDFSASRREYRAQVRHGAAEHLREQELQAQAAAEGGALEAEQEALAAEARFQDPSQLQEARMLARRSAAEAAQRAAALRTEAAQRGDAAAQAAAVVLHEAREIDEARASADRQALNYAGSDSRLRQLASRLRDSPTSGGTTASAGVDAPEDPAAIFALDLSREAASLRFTRGRDPREVQRPSAGAQLPGAGAQRNGADGGGEKDASTTAFDATLSDPEPGRLTLGRALRRMVGGDLGRFRVERTEPEPLGPAWLYAARPAPVAQTEADKAAHASADAIAAESRIPRRSGP